MTYFYFQIAFLHWVCPLVFVMLGFASLLSEDQEDTWFALFSMAAIIWLLTAPLN